VIRYLCPIRIRGIVENDICIYPYLQKFTDIRKYLSAVPYLNGGLSRLHCADEDAVSWLTSYG